MSNNTESRNNEPTNTARTNTGGLKKQRPLYDFNSTMKNTGIIKMLENGRYIDKTKTILFFLISTNRMICLRPRRMGKTTTIKTISAIARGGNIKNCLKIRLYTMMS
eukprot:GAHX01001441.1.p2 GENE.GAHX01001441.1~~GAHX01001441.1.p2  ORF type:complete len:121 (+),score=18.70 GAHX01001441.1:43-363(+)